MSASFVSPPGVSKMISASVFGHTTAARTNFLTRSLRRCLDDRVEQSAGQAFECRQLDLHVAILTASNVLNRVLFVAGFLKRARLRAIKGRRREPSGNAHVNLTSEVTMRRGSV